MWSLVMTREFGPSLTWLFFIVVHSRRSAISTGPPSCGKRALHGSLDVLDCRVVGFDLAFSPSAQRAVEAVRLRLSGCALTTSSSTFFPPWRLPRTLCGAGAGAVF
jgi:hypothetical protein